LGLKTAVTAAAPGPAWTGKPDPPEGPRLAAGDRPVGLEDVADRPRHGRLDDADAELLDVLERPPVEVLAPQVDLAAVHQEVLGVEDAAAGEGAVVDRPHRDPLAPAEPLQRLGVGLLELGVAEEAHLHPPVGRPLDRLDHRLQPAARLVGGVELGEVERRAGAVDHLRPDLPGIADVGVVEGRLDGEGLDQLDGSLRLGGGGRSRPEQYRGDGTDQQVTGVDHGASSRPAQAGAAGAGV
jgi:hypothetical protein